MNATAHWPAARRLRRFVIVGGGAAALLFVLNFVLVSGNVPPFTASLLAYAAAFAAAYTAQRNWTFSGANAHRRALPRYFALQAACALFSGLVSHITVSQAGLTPLAMAATTTVLTSGASFVLSTLWVFPERD